MLYSVFSENISAFGVFLAGIAAIASSLLSLRGAKKRANADCDQRIEDIKEAFRAGVTYEKRKVP